MKFVIYFFLLPQNALKAFGAWLRPDLLGQLALSGPSK